MNSNTLGIAIIIGIIIIGVMSNGEIFRARTIDPTSGRQNTTPSWISAPNPFPDRSGYTPGITNSRGTTGTGGGSGTGSQNQGGSAWTNQLNAIADQAARLSQTITGSAVQSTGPSPYVDRIKIQHVYYPSQLGSEYAILIANIGKAESVSLTGWSLVSTVTGEVLTFGNGTQFPVINQESNGQINVTGYSRIVVSSSRSPIGTSFRINKCTGFFQERKNFMPRLQLQCPEVIDEAPALSRSIDDDCLDYIETLPRCEVPDDDDFPSNIGRACENFLETQVSYESCVANHRNDADFFENEWRVYPDRPKLHWRKDRENIQLRDNFGRVVDEISF